MIDPAKYPVSGEALLAMEHDIFKTLRASMDAVKILSSAEASAHHATTVARLAEALVAIRSARSDR